NFQWLIFTSPNGVSFFFQQYNKITNRKALPEKLQIAVVGSKTEKAVNDYSYPVDFVNPGNTGEDLAEAFLDKLKQGGKRPNVLLALGNMARNVIQENLRDTANCFRLNIYETTEPETVDENIVQNVKDNRYEMIIFTSPSGVHNFLKFVGNSNPEKLRIACIGEITARAAREKGIVPLVVAENPSAEGIVNSIINFYH
ncbi:MAG TPA: uroporphyrinogen-III synthase, partial [Prolixibacteraceae bacterium]|nr:uroporphyrinogen-III synthase [Prolixibacteraceae bacterium]